MAAWQQSPFAGAQIDFSTVGNLYNEYANAQAESMQREKMRQDMAYQQAQRGKAASQDSAMKAIAAEGFPRDAQGNPDYQAAAERVFKATGNLDAAEKVLNFGATQQKLANGGTTDDIREYKFYLDEEQKAGRQPVTFNDFRLARGRAGAGPANVQEWEYYNKLSPDQKQQYLTMKRAEKYLDTGTQFVRPNPISPGDNISAIPKDISGATNAKEAGTIAEIFDPTTGQRQKVLRQPDGSWRPYGGMATSGVGELDRGTSTELYNKDTGAPVRQVAKDVAGAAAEQVRGKTQAEGEASLPKAANALSEAEIKNKVLLGDTGTPGDNSRPATPGTIDRAIAQSSAWTTGLIGSQLAKVPGTKAHDLSKTLLEVQANLGFDTLQQMRDNSPTGGALGNVTERELELLQSTWANLQQSQSREQLVSNLNRIKQIKQQFAVLKRQAYEADVKRFGASRVPNPDTGAMGGNVGPSAMPPATNPGYGTGGTGGQSSAPVRVNTPDEARRLPSGSTFIDPNGVVRQVP